MHIPKSGGSSVHAALEETLPPGSLAPQRFDASPFCAFDDFHLLRADVRSRIVTNWGEVQALEGYGVISGHFSLPTLLGVTDARSISTVLREPRSRLLSLYMFWRTPGVGDLMSPYNANLYAQRPLLEFLSEPTLAPAIDNQICRMLLYGDPRLPESDFAAPSDVESIAADAMERLDALGFVGILDSGRGLWHGLTRFFGVDLEPVMLNLTGEHGDPVALRIGDLRLTDDVFDLVEQRNAADLVVYAHALATGQLDARTRRRCRDVAFAHQLVKLGDLVGSAAARASERADIITVLRAELEVLEQAHTELAKSRDLIATKDRTIHELNQAIDWSNHELEQLQRRHDATLRSASWRLTAPLRVAKRRMRRA